MNSLKTFFVLCLLLPLSYTSFAQQKVAVAIAKRKTSCGSSTDLGYYWYSSPSKRGTDLRTEAINKVKNRHYDYENVETKVEYSGCTHMVIISAHISKNGCSITTYGVGYSDDRSSALKNAVSHLTGRNWSWKKSDGYTIAEEKIF